VVTVLLASWWLHETLTPVTLLGGGLILTAVLVVIRGEVRRSPPSVTADRAVGSSKIGATDPTASTSQRPSVTGSSGI